MNNKKSKQGKKRANNEFENLSNLINLFKYVINDRIKLIYKVFEYHFNDVKREDIINNKEILLGLWKYWLIDNFRDLNYKLKGGNIKFINDKGEEEIWKKWKEHKYKDYEYILSILEIDNYFYNPKVWEQFIKDYDDLVNDKKMFKGWHIEDTSIAKFSKKGNKIISTIENYVKKDENLDINDIIKNVQKLTKELKEVKREKEELKMKIIKPKSKAISDLAEYCLKYAIEKNGIPTSRDLEKGGMYKKSKWDSLMNDYEFVIILLALLKEKEKDIPTELYMSINNKFYKILERIQKKEGTEKSYAMPFNDNMAGEYNDDEYNEGV